MALLTLDHGAPMPAEEWLEQARHVPLGQSRRVRHGAEPDAAMVVRNEAGCWSAHCFRCHRGGMVRKDVVQLIPPPVMPSRTPGRLEPVEACALHSQIILMLQSKGVSLPVIRMGRPMYSKQDNRLVLTTDDGQLGRALGNGSPKWWSYHDAGYMRGAALPFLGARVALTEDWFSACKIGYYVPGVLPVACLGTRIRPALMRQLLTASSIVACFDGDDAGEGGVLAARRKAGLLGIPFSVRRPPEGFDPKDLKPHELQELLDGEAV